MLLSRLTDHIVARFYGKGLIVEAYTNVRLTLIYEVSKILLTNNLLFAPLKLAFSEKLWQLPIAAQKKVYRDRNKVSEVRQYIERSKDWQPNAILKRLRRKYNLVPMENVQLLFMILFECHPHFLFFGRI